MTMIINISGVVPKIANICFPNNRPTETIITLITDAIINACSALLSALTLSSATYKSCN